MPVYSFSFSANQAGKRVAVVDSGGSTVASGTLGPADAVSGPVVFSATLNSGFYKAQAFNGNGSLSAEAPSLLDTTGTVPVPFAAAGGGSSPSLTRGTLYLKASGAGIDVSVENWSNDGSLLPYELDTARGGLPSWASQDGDGFHINEVGTYLVSIAGKGTLTTPTVLDLIGIDIVDYNSLGNNANFGWYSDASDDSPGFTPQLVTPLPFFAKDIAATFPLTNRVTPKVPITLVGFQGDNESSDRTGAVLDVDMRIAITKYGTGDRRYTEADIS